MGRSYQICNKVLINLQNNNLLLPKIKNMDLISKRKKYTTWISCIQMWFLKFRKRGKEKTATGCPNFRRNMNKDLAKCSHLQELVVSWLSKFLQIVQIFKRILFLEEVKDITESKYIKRITKIMYIPELKDL